MIDLAPAEVKDPLAQFQSQKMDQEGMGKVVAAINDALPKPLPAHRIDKVVNMLWPELEKNIQIAEQRLDQDLAATQPNRSDRELLEDILNSIRGIARAGDNAGLIPLMGRGAYSRRAKRAFHLAASYAAEGSGARIYEIDTDPDDGKGIIFVVSRLNEGLSRKLATLAEVHGFERFKFLAAEEPILSLADDGEEGTV